MCLNQKEFTKTCWPNVVTSSNKNNLTKLFLAWDSMGSRLLPRWIAIFETTIFWMVVEPTPLKNISEIGLNSPSRDENKKYLKPPRPFFCSLATFNPSQWLFTGSHPSTLHSPWLTNWPPNATGATEKTGVPKMSCCFFLGQVINKWGRTLHKLHTSTT